MSGRVTYATLLFPPPRSPAYDAQTFSYDADTNSYKETFHELPFERTLISLNSKEYEFTDSELDLYCDGSGSNSSTTSSHASQNDSQDELDKTSLPTEGEQYALPGINQDVVLMNS